jgi:hypothetical protein
VMECQLPVCGLSYAGNSAVLVIISALLRFNNATIGPRCQRLSQRLLRDMIRKQRFCMPWYYFKTIIAFFIQHEPFPRFEPCHSLRLAAENFAFQHYHFVTATAGAWHYHHYWRHWGWIISALNISGNWW